MRKPAMARPVLISLLDVMNVDTHLIDDGQLASTQRVVQSGGNRAMLKS
jgi:hypothetical protein